MLRVIWLVRSRRPKLSGLTAHAVWLHASSFCPCCLVTCLCFLRGGFVIECTPEGLVCYSDFGQSWTHTHHSPFLSYVIINLGLHIHGFTICGFSQPLIDNWKMCLLEICTDALFPCLYVLYSTINGSSSIYIVLGMIEHRVHSGFIQALYIFLLGSWADSGICREFWITPSWILMKISCSFMLKYFLSNQLLMS